MGTPKLVLVPWALLLLLLQLAGASVKTGYHFQPPKNWINDPNGPLYYKRWYHLFYQYNPNGTVWRDIIWAHSVSRDLVNWISLEPAIKPSIQSDKYGVWSGSATILHDGMPAMLYTGINRPDINYEVQNIEVPKNKSDPLLQEWVKPDCNLTRTEGVSSINSVGNWDALADVEVTFEVSGLEKAEQFNQTFSDDAQKLCAIKGADATGGVGPFGLWLLASANLVEKTAVFFRIFKDGNGKHVVLMCSDPTKSSLKTGLYKPTFAGFVHTDISSGEISLRSLIDLSVVESFGAGGKTCILSRVYPSIAVGKNVHTYVFNNGEVDIKVTHLTAWEMKEPTMNGV